MQKTITQTGRLAILFLVFSMMLGCAKQPTEIEKEIEINQIVFVSDRDGDQEIFTMNLEGKAVQQLTDNNINDSTPAWSRDGKKIVFSSERFGREANIFKMNADGNEVIQLTSGGNDLFPDWSHNDKIVFQSSQTGNSEIFVMDDNGTNLRKLTDSTAQNYRPRWSPDGQRIVFYSIPFNDNDDKPNPGEIFVMNADGTKLLQLTQNTYDDTDPSFSRNGSKIVFVSDRGNGPEIFVMDANGGNQQRLTTGDDRDLFPIFAASYDRIAFVRYSNTQKMPAIYVMDANGENPKNLTDNKYNDSCPDW